MKLHTWHKELIFVFLILSFVWAISGFGSIEALGAAAVIFTFCHTQVAFRLEEKQKIPDNPHKLSCYHWQSRYFLIKELCWLGYFIVLGAWSALVGVFLFLVYPLWRRRCLKQKGEKRDLEKMREVLDEWEV